MIISTFKNESYHYDFQKNVLNVNIFYYKTLTVNFKQNMNSTFLK